MWYSKYVITQLFNVDYFVNTFYISSLVLNFYIKHKQLVNIH